MIPLIAVIIDIILVLILALCAYKGFRKGLILGITGLIALAVSLYGANLLADTFSSEFTGVLQPFVSGIVYKSVDDYEERAAEEDYVYEGPKEGDKDEAYRMSYESLRNLGIIKTAAENITSDVRARFDKADHEFKEALVDKLTSTIAYVLTFIIGFVLILIIFIVIANVINLAFKLPGLEIINEILGALLGLAKGLVIAFVLAWFVRFLGFIIPEEEIDRTLLLSWLIKVNPITAVLGI